MFYNHVCQSHGYPIFLYILHSSPVHFLLYFKPLMLCQPSTSNTLPRERTQPFTTVLLHHCIEIRFSHLCVISGESVAVLSFTYLLLHIPTQQPCFGPFFSSLLGQKCKVSISLSKTNTFIGDLDPFLCCFLYVSFLHSSLCFMILISPFPQDRFREATDLIY